MRSRQTQPALNPLNEEEHVQVTLRDLPRLAGEGRGEGLCHSGSEVNHRQPSKAHPLRMSYRVIQMSLENSFSRGSATRASASEPNLTRTRQTVPLSFVPRSTYAEAKPPLMSFAASASAAF